MGKIQIVVFPLQVVDEVGMNDEFVDFWGIQIVVFLLQMWLIDLNCC